MSMSFTLSLPVVREARGIEMRTPADTARELREITDKAQECFFVLTLDTKYKLIDKHMISLGIVDACLVHPREVFRCAITDGAAAVVLAHNHPSGDPTPSREDIKITRQMIEAGRIMDIQVLDHIVLGRPSDQNPAGFISLRESGLVSFVN